MPNLIYINKDLYASNQVWLKLIYLSGLGITDLYIKRFLTS